MAQTLLTLFIILFAPIPWVIIAIHVLIKFERWSTVSKKLLVGISVFAWIVFGYWLFTSREFLFAAKFNNGVGQVAGILVLLCAAIIELLTTKTLGTKRIFGSSEFQQTKDQLITHGIYKYARHPRYVEHPLWALGLGLTFGYQSLLLFFVYLLIGFMLAAYFEEQELIKRYGEEYVEYKKKVPAFFIRLRSRPRF